MQPFTRSTVWFSATIGFLLGLGVGAISDLGMDSGWWPGVVAFVGTLAIALRKPLRRWRLVREPMASRQKEWLNAQVEFYRSLAPDDRARFEADVRIVLSEWRFEGVGGAEVTEHRRLSVAAGAALLLHGHPEWELPYRQTVLFYTENFGDDYETEPEGEFDGMAHQQGPVILSARALDDCWSGDPEDGNVVLHELAHLLDYKTEFADGIPSLVDARSADAWSDLVLQEMDRVDRGDSILPDYAATEPAELFACAVESFFMEPDLLERHHPELFVALRVLFNLDPRSSRTPREQS